MIADESPKTKRIRVKLGAVLKAREKKITPQALQKTKEGIKKWIADHQPSRVMVEKGLRLFDQNENAARLSKRVEALKSDIFKGLG